MNKISDMINTKFLGERTTDQPIFAENAKRNFCYEAEIAFVIGKQARNVSEDDALDYVAGYTIANDVTYRDIQRRTLQWLQGKTVEGSAPLGPWLITSDELTDPSGLEIVLTVNGEERQRSNTENLVFTVQKLVAFLSNLMTLEPGEPSLIGPTTLGE